jgi:hypothetical protein
VKFDVDGNVGHGRRGGFDGISDEVAPETVTIPMSGALGGEGLGEGRRDGRKKDE